MPENFNLTIRLGNDAMQSPYDLALALRKLAGRLADDGYEPALPDAGTILDDNGNNAGTWEIA